MRWLASLIVTVLCTCSALAEPAAFNAGVIRLTGVGEAASFDTVIFYPTHEREVPWQAGLFTVEATRNASPVPNGRFPVVLISHGRGGGPFSHRELAATLARAGFIVVLPTHAGDASGYPRVLSQAQILIDRPRQAEAALNAVLTDPRFSASADVDRIGVIGYSAGGYTALILAGAKPDFAYASAYCANHDDPGSCPRSASGNGTNGAQGKTAVPAELVAWQPPVDRRLKALVLMDPLAMMFEGSGLSAVRIPTMLYRPQDDSYLGSARNALAVVSGLPAPPAVHIVPGNHFVFIDPCPASVVASVALICRDAPGIDRVEIHRQIDNQVVEFLRTNL
ncbi:putative dienelactone hydrolase [Paraburkholderia sp. BL18I3N2]|uniref:alpha/beta hydrolase family protein n=1 Tax=Paraburkholderia sp. BL18I3N2 TaxID=1938799 RepID=UPI000D05E73C|nr:dienelactone hydrolase family protein [Paraburkholderia sp. BL18I3N2]PRX22336.1 putative dienelactone hydrolase [Paraburkholderia sp. BL18I3N2]